MSWDRSPLDAVNVIREEANGQVVLVLQGGGALGAYQGGVYEALHEAKVEPDWIIGTSIGAINAAIIAGNAVEHRLDRLREFWRRVERNAFWSAPPAWSGVADSFAAWATVTGGVSGFFETNPRAFLGAHVPLGTDAAGYYSTAPLRKTLSELVDFALVNRNTPRLMVGAAHVRTSMMHYFDSRKSEIKVEHILASGALPPAFPAVRIDGELYWDGGILSNTPTEAIFDDDPRRNSLIFAVHMWNPTGPEPGTIWEVLHRHKDIQYSSRIANHIMRQREAHRLRHVINELVKCIPDEARRSAMVRELAAYGCPTRMHVVRLLAPRLDNESHIKDIDFSPSGIRSRWQAGYVDTCRALARAPWIGEFGPLDAVVLHEPEPDEGHGRTPAAAEEAITGTFVMHQGPSPSGFRRNSGRRT
jgi:NTE family protein